MWLFFPLFHLLLFLLNYSHTYTYTHMHIQFVTDLPQNYSHPMMSLPSTADSIDGTHAKPFLLDTRGKDAPRMLNLTDVRLFPSLCVCFCWCLYVCVRLYVAECFFLGGVCVFKFLFPL